MGVQRQYFSNAFVSHLLRHHKISSTVRMRSRVLSDSGFSSDSNETFISDLSLCATNHGIQEHILLVEEKLNSIKSAKEEFLAQFSLASETIEKMTRKISASAQGREETLKNLLLEVRNLKIEEWDRQLELCQEAEANLTHVEDNFGADVQAIAWNFAKKIGLVDAGDIKFEAGSKNLWKEFEKLGKFSNGPFRVNKQPEKLKPKFVLQGKDNERFNRPWGVCSDPTGRILVADCSNHQIQVFNEFGGFLFCFGKSGTESGEFSCPTGIAVDKKCRILVADKDNHRIQVFTFTGGFLLMFGERGTAAGEFQQPWDIAVNDEGQIAVSDTQNHRIQLFNTCGVFIAQFRFSIFPKFKVCPRGIAFKPDGTLMVTDFYNNSVLLIDRDFTAITEFETLNFSKPQGIACSNLGKLAVADGTNCIQVFDEGGNLCRLFGGRGKKLGEFDCVQGICFQPDESIVVTEFWSNRVQVF